MGGVEEDEAAAFAASHALDLEGAGRVEPADPGTPREHDDGSAGPVVDGDLEAIAYARSLHPDRLLAVTVVADAEQQDAITRAWADHDLPVELRTLYSPCRELSRPIMRFVEELVEVGGTD